MQCLHRKGIVDWKTLKDITEMLASREAAHKAADESSDETVSGDDKEEVERQKRRRFSDTLIQQRMEEDRERVRHLSPPNSSRPADWAVRCPAQTASGEHLADPGSSNSRWSGGPRV